MRSPIWTTINLLPGYCGLPEARRDERLVIVLSGNFHWFFDDSGSEPTTPVFVLAGFLASAQDWADFNNHWQSALDLPPRLEYFKMVEAATLRPKTQFSRDRGWTEEKRDERVRKLTHVIREHVKLRISASIRHDHFAKYYRSLPAIGRRLATDNPYPYLFSRLMAEQLVFSHRKNLLHKHDIVMDEQTGMEAEIREQWPDFKRFTKEHGRPQYGDLIGSQPYFFDDKQFLPLQAADLYAWHVRDSIQHGRPQLGRVLRMLKEIPSLHLAIGEKELAKGRERLMAQGEALKRANPLLQLVSFPETKRDQYKARRAFAKKRGAPPSPRRPRS
jgi:hypothetical protein